jgi:hypothetical protein
MCGPCVCCRQLVKIIAERARAVPPAQSDRPPPPALVDDTRRATRVCAAGGAARSRRDEHALCRPRDATALPSQSWRRKRSMRPVCVRPAAHRDRCGTSTRYAARAKRPPPFSRRWRRVLAVQPMCVPSAARRDRGGTSTLCVARATRPPSPACYGGGRAVRLLSASIDTLCLILISSRPRGQLSGSRDDHGLAWLARTLEHVLCMQPASQVTLPTVQHPARTAPSVVESLSFLHRAPSPDALRLRVLARRTGRQQRPAAVGRAGQFDSGKNCIVLGTRP